MRSLEQNLGTELMRKVGWWDRSVTELIADAIAEGKAQRSSESRKVQRTKSHYLQVAAGGPRNSAAAGGAQKPAPEALTAATASTRQVKMGGKNGARERPTYPPSTKHMQQLYSPEQWKRRTAPIAGQRPHHDPAGADKELFERDRHPVTGKPYCVSCKKEGHTLASCPELRSSKRKRGDKKQQGRQNNRPRK